MKKNDIFDYFRENRGENFDEGRSERKVGDREQNRTEKEKQGEAGRAERIGASGNKQTNKQTNKRRTAATQVFAYTTN